MIYFSYISFQLFTPAAMGYSRKKPNRGGEGGWRGGGGGVEDMEFPGLSEK